ncbi:MAG: hypothetical protein ACETWG_03790, partial [Candidatus Neomarinimicrobiota bacterium]
EFSYNRKYGPSTKLAIGVGYTPRLKRIRLPLYAAYIGHWMPVTDYYGESEAEAKRFSHNLAVGMRVLSGGVGIHAVVQMTSHPFQTNYLWPWEPWAWFS